MANKILSAEEILAAPDLEERTVHIPEWKGDIKVKSLSKQVHQSLRTRAMKDGEFDLDRYDVEIFIHGVVEPKFTEENFEALRQKNAGVIERINRVILQISGLTPEAIANVERFFR